MQKKIIFHHPLPINPSATSASGIRPRKMIEAFESIGYNVYLVTGFAKERSKSIKMLKKMLKQGQVFEFLYSESSTMPTLLTETHHLPTSPSLDFAFFKYLKSNDIPIGLFYRDIYWAFDEYGSDLNPLKRAFAKWMYRYDLKQYERYVDTLYLPSMKMGKYIPIVNESKFLELPPGQDIVNNEINTSAKKGLDLLYIGGMSGHYQMHEAFVAVSKLPDVTLTVCTREVEWQTVKDNYISPLPSNINIVHKSGSALNELFYNADIAMLFVKPQEYREFASPVKLYEYIGYKKPIIASKGTLSGLFVENNGIGWSIDYYDNALVDLLGSISVNPELLKLKREKLNTVYELHTWQQRAKSVVENLKGKL
jgi:glycosyltransferase involved in cell wall biosynthesis